MTYLWRVTTRRNATRVRATAREAYRAARETWKAGDRQGPYPSLALEACAWVAQIECESLVWEDGGSSERIAVQRTAAHVLRGLYRRREEAGCAEAAP